MRRIARITIGCAMMMVLSWSTLSWAATTTYCMTPPFVQAGILPNLLLLIDNSASMFDLTYSDKGLKHCSNSSTVCTADSDCGSGGTCSVFDRNPMYCFDETYEGINVYIGYFNTLQSDNSSKQFYTYDFTSSPGKFDPASTFSCSAGSGETARLVANELCVIYNPTLASTTKVTKFLASGNYLNWLTASKFDVEKKILTGGRYSTSNNVLLAESRGCVGQGYVKEALDQDFINFSDAVSDPNTSHKLKITFRVHGPANTNNPTAPSQGGSTGIDIFIGDTAYNYKACQDAVVSIASGTNAEIKQNVGDCLAATVPAPGYCKLKNTQSCTTSTDCMFNSIMAQSAFVCTGNTSRACTGLTDTSTCKPAAQNVCQNKQTITGCTIGVDSTCNVNTAEVMGTCGGSGSYSPTLPSSLNHDSHVGGSCRENSDCTITDTKTTGHTTTTTTYTTSCSGHVAASTNSYGPCINTSPDYGTCVANYYGECVLPASTVVAKTKVAFQQSLQACWALRNNGTAIGVDDIKTVTNQCPDVFGGYANGPLDIQAGSYALLCSENYEGQMYSQSAAGQPWILRTSLPASTPSACNAADSVETCMEKIHTQFCNDASVSNVTDPTDDPSNTTLYGNIPAILSGIGVEAQMGAPLATNLRARVNTSTVPTGLIQDFASKIRMGVMSFNYDGSASEITAWAGKKYCSNDTSRECSSNSGCQNGGICVSLNAPKVCSDTVNVVPPAMPQKCTSDIDCTSPYTCVTANNRDGASILAYINKGHCSLTNTTNCTKDAHCPSGETCVADGIGDHASGLINTIDSLKAATWTPFGEAFYNAIGYFAADLNRDSSTFKYSRANATDSANNIRLNVNDFSDTMNPSQYRCQQNNILLISDGMATMDQNSTVNSLAALYHGPSNSTGFCPTQFGSKNLDDLAYLANHYNINTFNLLTANGTSPANNNEFISTYVVFNGDSNGVVGTDECNSETLLTKTAQSGGTSLYKAINPSLLQTTLKAAFDDISSKTSSGTAAAVANNRSGERGANIIQALFYPKWPADNSIKWLGDIQALWFYIDPIVKFSGIYEDTDQNRELDLSLDHAPGSDPVQVKALWKAGEVLHTRAASDRNIYTLLDPANALTDVANEFKISHMATLKPFLNIADDTMANNIINYVRGVDILGTFRSRTVTNNSISGVWKLGDVINSTPQIQNAGGLNGYNRDYGDTTYLKFVGSNQYQSNNYVYAGSNDGMLHAFKLGSVQSVKDPSHPFKVARISDPTDIGKEMWGFIPKNVLPYLKNCAETDYCHQFLVDGTPLVFDASINSYTGCAGNYWDCPRQTILNSSNNLDPDLSSWKTVVIGSMGLGGATRDGNCNETLNPDADPSNNTDCIKTPLSGAGFSSYFALDITSPTTPKFMWEFSDASINADTSLSASQKAATRGLGLTTPGGIQLRINSKGGTPVKSLKNTNGRWFAVFPSGPTGAIGSTATGNNQFLGRSDQNLKIYIVDINPSNSAAGFTLCSSAGQSGCNYWVKDTNIKYAFANSLFNASIDLDKDNAGSDSYYSDDMVYITYTRASLDSTPSPGPYPVAWDKGGVVRLVTNNDPDPFNWFVAPLIDGIGPITRSVDILQDKNNQKLWVFFGEGRYFYRQDDLSSSRRIFGIADPCYSYDLLNNPGNANKLSTTSANCIAINSDLSELQDQSNRPNDPLDTGKRGWYIDLDGTNGVRGAERLNGGISSRTNGIVFFTTFIPSTDPCDAGGFPSQWAVKYNTGGTPPAGGMKGKIILTTSDSPIARPVNIEGLFTQRGNRKLSDSVSQEVKGMPPPSPPPTVLQPAPAKRILHIQER